MVGEYERSRVVSRHGPARAPPPPPGVPVEVSSFGDRTRLAEDIRRPWRWRNSRFSKPWVSGKSACANVTKATERRAPIR
jgi:hypothetical protein